MVLAGSSRVPRWSLSVMPAALLTDELLPWTGCADIVSFLISCRCLAAHLCCKLWEKRAHALPAYLLEQIPECRPVERERLRHFFLRRRAMSLEARAALTSEERSELDYSLCCAAYGGSPCRQLMLGGASPHAKAGGRPALVHAAMSGHIDGVKAFLSAGADLETTNRDGDTPLVLAVIGGHMAVVETLIANGANLETRDCHGDTPLICAVVNGLVDMVRLLVSSNSNIEARDLDGDTPLICAIVNDQAAVVTALLQGGADVNPPSGETSPLARAAADVGVGPSVGEALIVGGAHLEAVNAEGHTPLMCAAIHGRFEFVRALIGHGVNLNARGYRGGTSTQHAIANGHDDVARALSEAGAEECDAVDTFDPLRDNSS